MEPPKAKRTKTLLSLYRKEPISNEKSSQSTIETSNEEPSPSTIGTPNEEPSPSTIETPNEEPSPSTPKERHLLNEEACVGILERDPSLRLPIWKCPVNQIDEIRRRYIELGPNQPNLKSYPPTQFGAQCRRFQSTWFAHFPWLEYSESKDAAFCFPCFIFESKLARYRAFTTDGFRCWKRVNNGERCAFLIHVGGPTSPHSNAVNSVDALRHAARHIDKVINAQSIEEIRNNRLRLKTSIESIRWLTMQACALRGHDESSTSNNMGNFIEMIKLMAKMNPDIDNVVLDNAPGNAKYTSPTIQKEILHIFANRVRKKVREEIGDAKFCILVDEAKDISSKEQMAIVLRFVDREGFLRERFFEIVHVKDTAAATLKKEICDVLGRHNLHIHNMRGQGYDGASNMRGSWNGLQALFLRDSPYAYYVHCFAHRLQLALVAAAEKQAVWLFFSKLTSIVNIICASPKRHTELHSTQVSEVARLIANGERDTGRGANQICNLQRAGKTRWSSHFESICSMVDMFGSVITVLQNIVEEGSSNSIRGEAHGSLTAMKSFDFVFILHLMHRITGITSLLCKSLQDKSLDILNAMDCVSSTKATFQKLRANGFDVLLMHVKSVCLDYEITIPNMDACYKSATGRSCQQRDFITIEHRYRFDLFNEAIDFQVEELHSRFNDEAVELLRLSSALEPKENFKSFKLCDIYDLAKRFYPGDFTEQEMHYLKVQLENYENDVPNHERFRNLSTISELCQRLFETNKSKHFHLIDRLIRLVLTLPVSTATTERAFSAMKLVKSVLRNKMEEGFLTDSLVVYIERELVVDIDSNSMIDEFYEQKNRRAQLK